MTDRRWHPQFGDRTYKEKPTWKKWKPEKLQEAVLTTLKDWNKRTVYAETVAKHLKAKTHEVRQVFHKLNLQGIMGQAQYWSKKGLGYMHTRFDIRDQVLMWEAKKYSVNLEKLKDPAKEKDPT